MGSGARIDGIRRGNLSALLGLVHREGSCSRAQLTAHTGLNRSTVADLVGALSADGLVEEHDPDPTHRVGRPSPVVVPDPRVVAVAVNPEVDAVTVGLVRMGGQVVRRVRSEVARPPSPAETARIVAETLRSWRGESSDLRIEGAGVAVPGLVRSGDGVVRLAPHLDWRDENIGGEISAATGLSAVVGNDATLGAWAEHLFGAARGVDDVVYLNGGASGIGGGLVVSGALVRGAGGYAGEWGQNRPAILSSEDRRTAYGVLEDEVNRSLLLEAVGIASADEPTLARALAATADPGVAAEVARQRRILATALVNAVNVLNPSMIVLGGFLATLADMDIARLHEIVRDDALVAPGEGVRISSAALGEDRLLIGAAEAVFAPLLADPLRRRQREAQISR